MKNHPLFVSVFLTTLSALANAEPSPVYQAADLALKSNAVTSEFARDPANATLVEQIRRQAKAGNVKSKAALLRISDPEITALCLARLRSNHWSDSIEAAEDLGTSGQLSLIPVLASDLNTDQSTEPAVLHSGEENFRIKPVSVLATIVIRLLIVNSPEFRPEVRAWATQLGGVNDLNRENARASLRSWWKQNESLLRAKQYSQAQVPISRR